VPYPCEPVDRSVMTPRYGEASMCFSATASFVSAGVVGVAGAAALPFVRDRRELPLALLGLGFAAHQLTEGVVWSQLEATGARTIRSPAVAVWLVFAWVLLPVWVPLAMSLVEPDRTRRRIMTAAAVLGGIVAAVLGLVSFTRSVPASVVSGHLSYIVPFTHTGPIVWAYVAATCGPPLLSTHPLLRAWGVALTVAMAATATLQARGFASLWCWFAALLTLVLTGFLASRRHRPVHGTRLQDL
jgi:hypothetical protein